MSVARRLALGSESGYGVDVVLHGLVWFFGGGKKFAVCDKLRGSRGGCISFFEGKPCCCGVRGLKDKRVLRFVERKEEEIVGFLVFFFPGSMDGGVRGNGSRVGGRKCGFWGGAVEER
jgi:hypothetical protein